MRNRVCIRQKATKDGFEYSLADGSRKTVEKITNRKIYTRVVHISRDSKRGFERENGTFFKYVLSTFNCNKRLGIPVSIIGDEGEVIYKKS